MYTVETQYNEILGTEKFCLLYQIFCYISSQKHYKTKKMYSLGLEKLVCYIRYCVISDLFISSFHCSTEEEIHVHLVSEKC